MARGAPVAVQAPPASAFGAHRPIEADDAVAETMGSFQAAAHSLTSWAMHSSAGRVCIYARLPRLGRGGVGERARQLHAMGLVRLLPQRSRGDGLFDYSLQRTELPFASARAVPDEAGLSPDARLLLDLLVQLADEGQRCPSDRDLAAQLGFKREATVQRHLGELRRRHLITTEISPEGVRIVTILETGERTAA